MRILNEGSSWMIPGPGILCVSEPHEGTRGPELLQTAGLLQQTLEEFKLPARVVGWLAGPTVTMYKVELARGVKLSPRSVTSTTPELSSSSRAGRIMDELAEKGVVGPGNGSRPREVLVDSLDGVGSERRHDEEGGNLEISTDSELYRHLYGGEASDFAPSFENFAVGEGNELAYKTALIVVDNPGEPYCPLFLYGPTGCGKTHLLKAIAKRTERTCPVLTVRYVPAVEFLNDYSHALRHNDWGEFDGNYQQDWGLLVDDVQLLEDEKRAMGQLFSIARGIAERGGQVVLACDHEPEGFKTDVRDRSWPLPWLVVKVDFPDRAAKRAILGKMMSRWGGSGDVWVTVETLDWLADVLEPNGHVLVGAMKTLLAGSEAFGGGPIGIEQARELVGDLACGKVSQQASIEEVQKAVEGYYGLKHEELVGPKRSRLVAMPRRIAIYLSRYLTNESRTR